MKIILCTLSIRSKTFFQFIGSLSLFSDSGFREKGSKGSDLLYYIKGVKY